MLLKRMANVELVNEIAAIIAAVVYPRQPDMSGDPLARLALHQKRRAEDAAREVLRYMDGQAHG
jgi:hypothetical protein